MYYIHKINIKYKTITAKKTENSEKIWPGNHNSMRQLPLPLDNTINYMINYMINVSRNSIQQVRQAPGPVA